MCFDFENDHFRERIRVELFCALRFDFKDNVCRKDVEQVVPRTAHSLADMELQQWTNIVKDSMKKVEYHSPIECKIRFLGNYVTLCRISLPK